MAEDMVRDMDAETLRDLMQAMQGMAPEDGAQPPPPEDLAEQLADLDPEVLRKVAEAAAGLEPPPGAERPELSSELREQLERIDPATREKLQQALAGLERPQDRTPTAGRPGETPGGAQPGEAQTVDGSPRTTEPGQPGEAQTVDGSPRTTDPGQGQPGQDPAAETGALAGGEGPPADVTGPAPEERRILLPSRTEVSVGEAGDGDAQASRDAEGRVESTGERASVRFGEIPEAFREQAEAALSRQRVPESYERVVREYFRPQRP